MKVAIRGLYRQNVGALMLGRAKMGGSESAGKFTKDWGYGTPPQPILALYLMIILDTASQEITLHFI